MNAPTPPGEDFTARLLTEYAYWRWCFGCGTSAARCERLATDVRHGCCPDCLHPTPPTPGAPTALAAGARV